MTPRGCGADADAPGSCRTPPARGPPPRAPAPQRSRSRPRPAPLTAPPSPYLPDERRASGWTRPTASQPVQTPGGAAIVPAPRGSARRADGPGGTVSAVKERGHLLPEGRDLVAQLVEGAADETHLQVRHAHVDELGQVLGDACRGCPTTVPRGSSRSGSPTWNTPARAPISMGTPPRSSWRSSRSWATWSRMSLRRTVWGSQPSPRCAARRNAARDDPPTQIGGRGCWTGRGLRPDVHRRPARARAASGTRRSRRRRWRRWPRPSAPPRSSKGGPKSVELLVDVPGPHADDDPAARQDVQGGELLGGAQRMALGRDVDVAT